MKVSAPFNPLVEEVSAILHDAGLNATLLKAVYETTNFGNAEAVFEVRSLLLHFVRDRGQDFLSLARIDAPENLVIFDDVEIAMGWKKVQEIIAKEEPTPLTDVVAELKINFDKVESAFSRDFDRFTRASFDRVARSGWISSSTTEH